MTSLPHPDDTFGLPLRNGVGPFRRRPALLEEKGLVEKVSHRDLMKQLRADKKAQRGATPKNRH